MELLLEKLIELLESQKHLYAGLLKVLQEEKAAAVNSHLEALNRAVKEKENVLLEIRILEEQRIKMLNQVAAALGLPVGGLTLKRLAQKAPHPYAGRVTACRSSLLSLTQSIQEINNSNRRIFKRSLQLVRGSINLLGNLRAPAPVYGQTGKLGNAAAGGRVLSGNV
jgi:flagellar biosynthesis/type III secretory pathway chaperone